VVKQGKEEFAIDDNGKIHKVKTNSFGQKIREAYSAPRVIVALILYFSLADLVQKKIKNGVIDIILFIVLVVVIRKLILNVIVSDEEIRRYKSVYNQRQGRKD
jgi:hypothetical protein